MSEDDIVLSEEDGDQPENRAASPGDSENELDDDDVVGDAADDDVGSASSDSDGENEGISAKTHVEAVEALAEGDDGSEGCAYGSENSTHNFKFSNNCTKNLVTQLIAQ